MHRQIYYFTKMRFYILSRNKSAVSYKQIMTDILTPDMICIPTVIPKVMDPYILWRQTAHKDTIRKFSICDEELDNWFSIQSNRPIHKILSAGTSLGKQMR